jgi:4a-hydroxytetrahydrobiopterin dehydratase
MTINGSDSPAPSGRPGPSDRPGGPDQPAGTGNAPVPAWRRPLSTEGLRAALAGLPDWRHRQFGLYTAYECATSAAAVELMTGIGQVCEELDHHPDLDWRYRHLFIDTSSHDAAGAVTTRDVRLAGRISELAAAAGAVPVPGRNRVVDVALDTRDPAALESFWATALGYAKDERTGDLRDPHRRGPGLWFQRTQAPDARPMHLDVTGPGEDWPAVRRDLAPLSTDRGQGREDARWAPRWWIYADADGNRVCLCDGGPDAITGDAPGPDAAGTDARDPEA